MQHGAIGILQGGSAGGSLYPMVSPGWPEDIGLRIKAARGYAGDIGQHELGQALEYSKQTIARMERGDRWPKGHEVRAIAARCGLPYEFFTSDWAYLNRLPSAGSTPAPPGELGRDAQDSQPIEERQDPGVNPGAGGASQGGG